MSLPTFKWQSYQFCPSHQYSMPYHQCSSPNNLHFSNCSFHFQTLTRQGLMQPLRCPLHRQPCSCCRHSGTAEPSSSIQTRYPRRCKIRGLPRSCAREPSLSLCQAGSAHPNISMSRSRKEQVERQNAAHAYLATAFSRDRNLAVQPHTHLIEVELY